MVAAMLESVQLGSRALTPARALSGGQKRKVCLGDPTRTRTRTRTRTPYPYPYPTRTPTRTPIRTPYR